MSLPTAFIERMQKQLPKTEWEAFFAVYGQTPVKGLRLNPLKGDKATLQSKFPFLGEQVPWEEYGFYHSEEKLGNNPYYMAGLAYSQEPSAMSVAPLLEVRAGDKVLDLCSAPGGKGTQMACRMQGKGIIVCNEPVFARAKILSQNVERLGITNAVVSSEPPEKLSRKLGGYFDKILVDAPCSGEGMFRKNADEALGEWSLENIALCAERQARILDEAVKMLKTGGRLAYSTCTFAKEEDEEQMESFLARHSEMRLIFQEKLYPHTTRGEGHFIALLEKTGEPTPCFVKPAKAEISALSAKAYRQFERTALTGECARHLHEVDGTVYALPEEMFAWQGLQVLRVGVRLGEVKNGRFDPNHALVMATRASDWRTAVRLKGEEVEKYLRGETLERENLAGWCAVCVDDYPVGLGKCVNGTVKNHLPKGLRTRT